MSTVAVAEINRTPERRLEILGTSHAVMFFGMLITLVLQPILLICLRPEDFTTISLVMTLAVTGILRPLQAAIRIDYESRPLFRPISIASSASILVASFSKILVLSQGWSIYALVMASGVETLALTGFLVLAHLQEKDNFLKWTFSKKLFIQFVKLGFPLFLAAEATELYMRIDLVMVGDLFSNTEAGLYSVAVTLSQIWYFIPVVIYSSLFPGLISQHKHSREEFFDSISQFYKWMALLTYAVCIPVSLLAHPVVLYLYGEEYTQAGNILALLIWSLVFVNLGVVRNAWIYCDADYGLQFKITLVSCLINIALNIWLIPSHGATGATVATLLSYSYATFFSNFLYKSLRPNIYMMLSAMASPIPRMRFQKGA